MVLMEELARIASSTYTGGYSEQTNDIVKPLSSVYSRTLIR